MRRVLVAVLASLGLSATPVSAASAVEQAEAEVCEACEALLEAALAHPRRGQDKARDGSRNPAETLAFFKIRPGMTVVDYMPSSGWYTRILVPYLGGEGRYVGLNPAVPADASETMARYYGGLAEKFPAQAAQWELSGAPVAAFNSDQLPAELAGTADRVLMFRTLHNLRRTGLLPAELQAVHGLLKLDGLLGIVQHRAKADAATEYADGSKGYLRQSDVIELVESQGFVLVGSSEINANPKDSADHPQGVWELPPALRTGREELRAVGESDRMTLLFAKRP